MKIQKIPLILFLSATVFAADSLQPARLFFSDANLSFTFPNHWETGASFPFGPLFSKTTKQGSQAFLSCEVSAPLNKDRLLSDVPYDILQSFARQDLSARYPNARLLVSGNRWLAGHHAFEMTWETAPAESSTGESLEYQSIYFFNQDRIYALTLRAHADSFLWLVPDFQEWLTTVRILSRRDAGALDNPANGGTWIHQTGGAKISFPEAWLIGVADDHTVGAAMAREKKHSEFTATVDVSHLSADPMTETEKQEVCQWVEKKGFRIRAESDEPFHGLPAFHLEYDGTLDGRFVRGRDVWVCSSKGRWLLNLEADGAFFVELSDDYRTILNTIEFINDNPAPKS
ncbi:MAG: hypothetical protein WC859_06510 [Elusimicrobiota bacterium]|jgi:hypothetical protein